MVVENIKKGRVRDFKKNLNIMIQKIKVWFFKNLAEQVLKIKPQYSVPAKKKERPSAQSFISNDLFIAKQQEAEEKARAESGFAS